MPEPDVDSEQFHAGFEVARFMREPAFRVALREAGYAEGMLLDGRDVLDAVRPDGAGGWTVTRRLRPVVGDAEGVA